MKIKFIILVYMLIILSACKVDKNNSDIIKPELNVNFDDSKYIQDSLYKKGDSRRYGVFPNQKINEKALENCIFLSKNGVPITFSNGYYNTNIILAGVTNINLIFNNAILTGSFQIIEKDERPSENISIEGELTILDKLFIRKSTNITFDALFVKTDTTRNIFNKKNRGVSIYAGSKKISFNRLIIDDTGGDSSDFYKYTAASLQIHGWNDNPEDITVNNLEINNAARTAIYVTGNNHTFKKIKVFNFGLGSPEQMFGLEDTTSGEEQEFSGTWINRANNCTIDSLEISSTLNKGMFSLRLDEGIYHQPTFINNIHFEAKAKQLPIKDDELTNILVKNEY